MNYSFYKITDFINSVANGHPHIKTFQMGTLDETDTFKQTLFPLCYLVPGQATINVYSSTVYTFTLMVMDRVENTNNEGLIDEYSTLQWDYRGLDNLNDVWNDTISTLNDIISFIQRNAESNAYQIYDDVTCIPFKDRFDNLLAGWAAEINIVMPNDKPACEITLN
jgi:hypothetical protein